MTTVASTAIPSCAKWNAEAMLIASSGGAEQQYRVLAALRACLADDALPQLPEEMRTLFGVVTWAQVADTMRIVETTQWCAGLPIAKSAMSHRVL